MADDLNKNIVIEITAETTQLQQSLNDITKAINDSQEQKKAKNIFANILCKRYSHCLFLQG